MRNGTVYERVGQVRGPQGDDPITKTMYALTVGTTPSAAPYITYRMPGGAKGVVYQSTDRGATRRSLPPRTRPAGRCS